MNLLGNLDEGLKLEIVMTRRIINEILTTYLPTALILSIVYATTFFKPFFFEERFQNTLHIINKE